MPTNKDADASLLNDTDANQQPVNDESNLLSREAPSSDTNILIRTSAKHKQDSTPSTDKRQKSSSTVDENDQHRRSLERRSGQKMKQSSNIIPDETVVTPIIMDTSKVRQHSGNVSYPLIFLFLIFFSIFQRGLKGDFDNEQISTSKLPLVNSSFQPKTRRSQVYNKQKTPISNRSDVHRLSSSHASTASDDEGQVHWTKKLAVPAIHLTDDEAQSLHEEQQLRPRSPNAGQIAERNQAISPPLIAMSTAKKRGSIDKKRSVLFPISSIRELELALK